MGIVSDMDVDIQFFCFSSGRNKFLHLLNIRVYYISSIFFFKAEV